MARFDMGSYIAVVVAAAAFLLFCEHSVPVCGESVICCVLWKPTKIHAFVFVSYICVSVSVSVYTLLIVEQCFFSPLLLPPLFLMHTHIHERVSFSVYIMYLHYTYINFVCVFLSLVHCSNYVLLLHAAFFFFCVRFFCLSFSLLVYSDFIYTSKYTHSHIQMYISCGRSCTFLP